MSAQVLHSVAPTIAARVAQPDVLFWCPGCKMAHGIWTSKAAANGARWSWNGSMEKPTFEPSLLVTVDYPQGHNVPPVRHVCHSFVREGMIQFLSDCTHDLKNQTVALEPF